MTAYYCNDFSFDSYSASINLDELPTISSSDSETKTEEENWNNFYEIHETGRNYKPRNYISLEFAEYLAENSDKPIKVVLEAGCGHGSSILPLLQFPHLYFIVSIKIL